jgi:hypothetical protein
MLGNAQTAAKPKVENIKATYTSPANGKEMFDSYCASCQGKETSRWLQEK